VDTQAAPVILANHWNRTLANTASVGHQLPERPIEIVSDHPIALTGP
jgi:hypothetical protein